MTVAQLLDALDSRELTEWMAFEKVDGPIGAARDDALTAVLAATVANTAPRKGKKPFKPADFLPQWGAKRKTVDEHLSLVERLNVMFGGRDERSAK